MNLSGESENQWGKHVKGKVIKVEKLTQKVIK
jgi:hypothetical protein